MNPNLNWGNQRAAQLLAEAEQRRQARETQAQHPRPQPAWNFLRFILPTKRPRLT